MSQVDDALHGKLKQGRKTNKKLRRQVRVLIRSRQEILEGAVAAKTLLYGPPRFPIAVIENMAKHLTPSASYRTLAHLGTASRELYEKIKPILYRRVLWDSNTKWRRMFPCAKKRFRPRVIPAGWQYTK
ncbi:hypothetical protein QFC21_005742 [Naganishia friedmannii]|uniref:Uncharacterized protein n=1 Tax=Naganishia friedmannii TaxID=89922 RepID=A0ACC2V7S0_9TREE|nr:hypothetical protein QFC21_005742 [Naganishia friedmannii]